MNNDKSHLEPDLQTEFQSAPSLVQIRYKICKKSSKIVPLGAPFSPIKTGFFDGGLNRGRSRFTVVLPFWVAAPHWL
jgi:hypothetical protein